MTDETMAETPTHEQSGGLAKLAAALAAAQADFAAIPKDREVTVKGDFGSYKFKYATMDAIMSATRPALAKQGLAVVQGMISRGTGYAIETKLLHSSGEWLRNTTPMFVSGRFKDGKQYPPTNQELGSAQTYARRYGLSALLCITADEDDDGNTADGNSYESRAQGTAGAGTDFRSEKRNSSANGRRIAAAEPQLATTREKGTLPKPGEGREATPEQARIAKFTAATDKRIAALKEGPWDRGSLKKFWDDDGKWRDWMADPANEALAQYDRYTTAFTDAQDALQGDA